MWPKMLRGLLSMQRQAEAVALKRELRDTRFGHLKRLRMRASIFGFIAPGSCDLSP